MSANREHVSFGRIFTGELAFWVRHNRRLSAALPPKSELISLHVTTNDVYATVDLKLFNEKYYKKFIEPDVELYSIRLLKAIEARVFSIIAGNTEPYTIRYEFHHHKGIYKKHVTYSFGSMIY